MRFRILFALASVLFVFGAQTSHAQLIAQEDFGSYADGASLNGQGGAGAGWGDGWHVSSSFGFFDVPGFKVTSPGWNDPNIVSSGKTARGGFTRLFRDLATPTSSTSPTWVSFVGPRFAYSQIDLNMGGDADSNRVAAFQFIDSPNLPTGNDRGINTFGGFDSMGGEVYNHLGDAPADGPNGPLANFYALEVNPVTHQVSYYVFLNGTRPTSIGTATYSTTYTDPTHTVTTFDRVGLFQLTYDGGLHYNFGISNLRIGDTFADVAPLTNTPEPATAAFFAITGAATLLRRRR